jgi:hypothetical protein
MTTQKTHFEQVPLAMVRKMIAEQNRREEYTYGEPATGSNAMKPDPQGAPDKSLEKSSKRSPLTVWTLW